jgi:hypothetical protein
MREHDSMRRHLIVAMEDLSQGELDLLEHVHDGQ